MYIEYEKRCDVNAIIGQVVNSINGLVAGSDSVSFSLADGREFGMYHDQDCCESVSIADVEGDVSDLLGSPLVICEEIDSSKFPAPPGEYVDSYTWTFYRIATSKGFVIIRWLGESNGYYSESVNFGQTN